MWSDQTFILLNCICFLKERSPWVELKEEIDLSPYLDALSNSLKSILVRSGSCCFLQSVDWEKNQIITSWYWFKSTHNRGEPSRLTVRSEVTVACTCSMSFTHPLLHPSPIFVAHSKKSGDAFFIALLLKLNISERESYNILLYVLL